jgi:ferredoxin
MADNPVMTRTFTITVLPKGWRFDTDGTVPLLKAAELAGIRLPSSCRNGTCRTCFSRMVSGQVSYRIEWPGLSREEKLEGYILPCVAYAESDIALEAGAARQC